MMIIFGEIFVGDPLTVDEIYKYNTNITEELTYPISGQCSHFKPPENTIMFSGDIKWQHWPEMG